MCNVRSGFALFGALIITLLLYALASGFALTERESAVRSAEAVTRTRLRARAETVIDSLFEATDWTSAGGMQIGTHMRRDIAGPPSAVAYVTRLDSTTYWIVARAFVGLEVKPSAESRIGLAISARADSSGQVTPARVSNRSWAELY